jgi:hypothetical protein
MASSRASSPVPHTRSKHPPTLELSEACHQAQLHGNHAGPYVTGVEELDKEARVWRAINGRKRCDVTGCSLWWTLTSHVIVGVDGVRAGLAVDLEPGEVLVDGSREGSEVGGRGATTEC